MSKQILTKNTNPKICSMDAISHDFTKRDWQEVENEKKYYKLVVKLRELRQKIGFNSKRAGRNG